MTSSFPNVSVYEIRGMEEHIAHAQILPRMGAVLFGFAGGCALLLSLTGLFGVVHYSVSRRSREIGIRMALGAEPQNVVSMILSQGMKLAACGSVLGLAAALATSRLLSSVLYGISPLDAVTFTLVPAVLLAAALLAALLPAWRASRMAPSMALREE
jgi:ABC-type antimicrobial peptide transport system permease subunit